MQSAEPITSHKSTSPITSPLLKHDHGIIQAPACSVSGKGPSLRLNNFSGVLTKPIIYAVCGTHHKSTFKTCHFHDWPQQFTQCCLYSFVSTLILLPILVLIQ